MAVAAFRLDDLELGQQASFETVITAGDIDAFAALSGDVSPLHVNQSFAQARGFGDRVVHGAYLVALASRLVGMHLPGRDALLLAVNVSFASPALVGARVTVTGTVDQVSDGTRSAVLKIRVQETDGHATFARMKATVGFTDGGREEKPAYG